MDKIQLGHFFKMNSGTDTGDIVSQKKIKIYKYDDASSLYKKDAKVSKSSNINNN